ncbi:hypothetical protein GCM10010909_21260 [Acidocella aquatica]|uniref:Transposase IS4-like domain-containing protein n=1 Tax=Acidocella aquatica TaxID=1922313 RepID=A0ABQ6ABK0_9PROT|nr:hypothetical protein GCM10010909_21260 [Acidocella aquatica]
MKADASDGGDGWSDSQIAAALETSTDTVAVTRQRLVEEGLEGALTRKHSLASARQRIFDGAAEAKLIALACSEPPKGRARWTLELLEEAVVELKIVARASDNTIGRTLKKCAQASPQKTMGHPAGGQRQLREQHGGRAGSLSAAARSGPPGGLSGRVMADNGDDRHIAIDGKTLRASKDANGRAEHVLSAFCGGLQTILSHEASRGKGLEIPDALKLLARLDLHDRIVTGDAIFCQKSITQAVVYGGGDYLLPIKNNQKTLRENIETAFAEPVFPPRYL